jgi:5'-nucleotidase
VLNPSRALRILAVAGVLVVALAACSDDSSDSGGTNGPTDTGTTTGTAEPFTILVSNDDGVSAEGIDLLVEGLQEIPDAEVIVYAPATNQTGAGNSTTPGPIGQSESQTRSGFPAVAVEGTPADSVNVALDSGVEPDVVVSGVNEGPNLGPLAIDVSGTFGAARAAATRGYPALAVSAGFGAPTIDYESAVDEAVTWVGDMQDELAGGDAPTELVNLNVPTCASGELKGLVTAPLATTVTEVALRPIDCAAGTDETADDVEAFVNGYAVLTDLPLD